MSMRSSNSNLTIEVYESFDHLFGGVIVKLQRRDR